MIFKICISYLKEINGGPGRSPSPALGLQGQTTAAEVITVKGVLPSSQIRICVKRSLTTIRRQRKDPIRKHLQLHLQLSNR